MSVHELTDAEWVDMFLSAPCAKQMEYAHWIKIQGFIADRCWLQDHDGRLEAASHQLDRLSREQDYK